MLNIFLNHCKESSQYLTETIKLFSAIQQAQKQKEEMQQCIYMIFVSCILGFLSNETNLLRTDFLGDFFFQSHFKIVLNRTKDSQIQIFNQNQGFNLICKLVVQDDFFPRRSIQTCHFIVIMEDSQFNN